MREREKRGEAGRRICELLWFAKNVVLVWRKSIVLGFVVRGNERLEPPAQEVVYRVFEAGLQVINIIFRKDCFRPFIADIKASISLTSPKWTSAPSDSSFTVFEL